MLSLVLYRVARHRTRTLTARATLPVVPHSTVGASLPEGFLRVGTCWRRAVTVEMADDYVTLVGLRLLMASVTAMLGREGGLTEGRCSQVSAEGFEFVIERKCALMSGTIKVGLWRRR